MAQFVTHIQPTLVESSHHHIPHAHHHKDHHKEHYKDYYSKDHHVKDQHGKDLHTIAKSPHKSEHREALHRDGHLGHSREYPILPHTPIEYHHEDETPHCQSKRDSGHYIDSHGVPHTFELHFLDSQGIHRDFHGHGIESDEYRKEQQADLEKHQDGKREDKYPYKEESNRPTPPQFIDIHSVHMENKYSDGNTSFLRAARNGQLDKVLEHLKSNIDINTSNANGLNALHLASKDGHVEIVEELLKRGAVVDAATKKGNTALHIASLAGQEEVVKLLVHHGASVNVQSQNGFTPLYMAAQENHDNVVKFLLANGANQSLSTEDGFTPLAVAMQQGHDKVVAVLLENDTRGKIRLPALHIAAKKDDVKAAKLLLENEHNPDVTSKSGFTPLHIASHYGNQQIGNLLIQMGADVNYAAKHNITPLHVAAKWGKTNMVALLLEHGATIESKTRDGLTPLHCAARSGHEQVVDMLLERGAPISSKTKNGLAPLHMAAQGDHVDAARILLYHRAPVDEVTVDYLTALHVAAHCGHVRVAKLLLDRQADANARALNGFTPLHIACKKNRIKVVELLLKHGASIGATTESGLTPLHVASFMGCMNIVIYLLQHDANPDVPTVRGETPLHLAARANQTDIIRILLRNGAQVDARAREQQTPLHIASRLGNVDIVMLLLQHGAKVDNTTKDMYTSLHIAAKEGQDEVAAVLLDNGASLDATTKKGFTPLHLAAKYGHLKVAELLLQKEAPVDAQGKNGVTPLHVASHYDHQNVALLLLDKGASPHATAKNGHTPLHIAARKNQMDIANTLLDYGAQPNAESKAGFTPLHLSAQEGHADISSLLLEHKADANYEAKNGLTPLHLCAQEDRVPVAEILVKNGANVNAATKGGYTPLHIASHYGQTNMVRFLLQNGANVKSTTSLDYTPLHQAAQQGHANIVNILLENNADPNAVTTNGQTPLNIAQKLGYITVIETLKVVTTTTTITTTTTTTVEEKYRVQAPELMHETFMSDSEEEGGEDTVLGDQTYRYLTADEMKSLGDDSLPIDVTRDERMDSNRMVFSADSNQYPPQHIEDNISPEHITQNYVEYIKKYTPDNVDIGHHPISIGFLVSFLVDARGGAMRGCRHSGVRVIVPPRCAPSPTRITCRYVRPQRTPHPPPLMEGEALASRVLELGPVGAKFLGPVIIEVPHFAALRGKEREIVILRSDNGESWKEHTVDATEEILNEVLHDSFEAEDLNQLEDISSGRITRIVTQDFPQYFAVVSRIRQEVHAIGPEGGMVSSTVVPQVQAVFPEGALTKKIKVGLQAQPIDPELTAKLLGHGVAVSPVVTVEPRRRKFHKAITLSMPAPRAHSQGMINQYSGSAPTLRLLCSITGGTTRAQWEDVTGSTPLTFVNDCVSFTTTVSARFWLMDCRNIGDATKMATELYKEAIHVPFMAKFVVFAKRVDPLEARLRVFCMTDDKEDKTLEQQEHFTEVAKSRDVEVLEGKLQYVEFAGNLVPITKSGEQLSFAFRAFRENRLPFSVRVKDQHAEAVSRCLFMKEAKVPKGEPPQQPICILNIVLPDDIVTDTISLTDSDSLKKYTFLSENFDYYRPDPRIADMSNLLGEDWVPLANQLGLTTSEINVIKSEYPDSVAKQAQSMLRMWLSQTGNKAQTNTIENALRRIGREDIIPQCLNVDQNGHTITRIKHEEIGKYRLKKDIDIIDKDVVVKEHIVDSKVIADKPEVKKKLETYDKYSAEEKAVEKSDEEEETFDKPVAERREKIEKRLSAERTIPASSQRREIVQEITSIKRQSIVEDKIAEVQQKTISDQKTTPDQKTAPEQKITPDQTKTTITKTVTNVIPGIKTVSETVEIKTTPPSDSKVSETVAVPAMDKVQQITTIVTETRTTLPDDITHRTAEDAELLEGVTLSLEKTKKPISKLIGDEDPKSPMFSKTPPPSPADFLMREQAATVQEWDASRKPAEPDSKAVERDATQGKTTSTTHYLINNEEIPLIEKPIAYVIPLKSIYDQTNALIQSESLAEPYHPHTEKNYIVKPSYDEKQDTSQTDSVKEEKKRKKGILGTIKTFVGKSLDHSDSESEKSPKKEKKPKKDKKKKKVVIVSEPSSEVPELPPRKPKLPTPTEDRKYADIPYFEASPTDLQPSYTPITTRSHSQKSPENDVIQTGLSESRTLPTTNLDSELDVPKDIKEKAKEIVTKVIADGENVVTQLQKSPKPKKQTVVIVDEIVSKTFSPASVEEEEFTITVDPTKKGSPKKTKETFTINIDDSIGKREKEILEKSPILVDEKLIKPIVHIEAPQRPPRIKDHVYEDIEEPSAPPHYLISTPRVLNDADTKTATTLLIQNEINFTGWADDKNNLFNINKAVKEDAKEKITDSQKMKRKHGKLLGFFGKSTKETDDSDEDSKKEIIEKHDSETAKEQTKLDTKSLQKPNKSKIKEKQQEKEITELQKSPKKGKDKEDKKFLGLFKKGKKEESESKSTFSDSVIKDMIDSTAFLKEEVDKYHDVKPVPSNTTEIQENTVEELQADKLQTDKYQIGSVDITKPPKEDTHAFISNEIDTYHDVRPKVEEILVTESKSQSVTEDIKRDKKEEGKGFYGLFKKKPSEEREITTKDKPVLSETVIIDMRETNSFLDNEVGNYHDVRPIFKDFITIDETILVEKPKHETQTDGKGFFGMLKKKSSEDKDIQPQSEEAKHMPELSEGTKKSETETIKTDPGVHPITKEKAETTTSSQEKEPIRPILSEDVIKHMHESDSFLIDEVKYYHDVRPIKEEFKVDEKIPTEDKAETVKHHDVYPTAKETSTIAHTSPTEYVKENEQEKEKSMKSKEQKGDGKGIFGLFKKKKSEETKSKLKKPKEKPALSANVIINMQDSESFLIEEINKYHDVRPIVSQKLVTIKKEVTPDEEHKDHGKDILEQPKKEIEKEMSSQGQEITEKPVLSENILKDMQESNTFLKEEVDKYHDVYSIIKKSDVLEEQINKEDPEKQTIEISKTRRSEEKKLESKLERKMDKPLLSEIVVKNMHESDSFLRDEIERYHDVRPVIPEQSTIMEESQPSETKQKGDGKGFLGLFKRKSEEKEVKSKTEKQADKPVISENVLRAMQETESFVTEEVNKYHDVRPVIKDPLTMVEEEKAAKKESKDYIVEERIPTTKEQKSDGKGFLGLFKKKRSDDKEIEQKSEKKKDKPVFSETVIKNMNESNSFLREEVDRYHDVRPILKEIITITTASDISESKDNEKGVLGTSQRKSEEKESKPKSMVDQEVLHQNVVRDMQESKSFLTEEIDKYHDVRPIVKEVVATVEENIPTTKEQKSDGKGFLGIFKKKRSDNKEIEQKAEKKKDKPVLSENVIKNMNESNSFLREEVDRYHDVRPIVKEIITITTASDISESKDNEKGVLGTSQRKSEEKESRPKSMVDQEVLHQNVVRDMQESKSFLTEEIDKYHDVRPIVKEVVATVEQNIPTTKEQKSDGKGFLGIFKKKRSDNKEIEQKAEKKKDKPVLSENVIKNMNESNSFLREEVDRYHDVRPIVKEIITITTASDISESKDNEKGVLRTSQRKSEEKESRPKSMVDQEVLHQNVVRDMQESKSFLTEEIDKYHDVRPIVKEVVATVEETIPTTKEQKSDGKGFLGIFKKKRSDNKEIEQKAEKKKDKPVFSETVIKNMNESNSFLREEVDRYHDVRPIVKEIITITTASDISESKDNEKGVLGTSQRKSEEKESRPKSMVDQKVLHQNVVRDMQESKSFLTEEIDKYHDVRPIVKEVVTTVEENIPTTKEQKSDGKGFLGIFKKKRSDNKEIEQKAEKKKDKPVLSENVIKNMNESNSFLREEVDRYHDVRPIVKEIITITTASAISESKDNEKGVLGTSQRKSEEKESRPKSMVDQEVLHQNVVRDMQESKSFLTEEIDKYHDVRPIIVKEVVATVEENIPTTKEQKSDGKGFLGIFKKKRSDNKEIEQKAEKKKDKPVFSENVIKNMNESNSFLKEEVDRYHDVRPIVKEIITITTKSDTPEHTDHDKDFLGISSGKLEEKESKPESVVDKEVSQHNIVRDVLASKSFLIEEIDKYHDVRPIVKEVGTTVEENIPITKEQKSDGKGFLGIFKKKRSDDKEIEQKAEKKKDKPVLSENVIKNMNDSNSFLKEEVEKYHDVRPIVKEIITTTAKSDTPEYTDKGKSFLGIFKRRSEEKEIKVTPEKGVDKPELSKNVVSDMQESKSFLTEEVNKYHDVYPLIKEVIANGEEKLPTTSDPVDDDKVEQKTKDKPVLSENVIKDMHESGSFLKEEVEGYHDVYPIVTQIVPSTTETTKQDTKEHKDDGKGFFGLFKKKKSEEKDIEPKIQKTIEKPVLSENVIKSMLESDSFLQEEINRYHDVRPVIKEPVALSKETVSTEKGQKGGKGFLGIFKKKRTDDKEIEPKIEKTKDKPVLSENVIKDMQESESFLQEEVIRYHDVRPIIKEPIAKTQIEKTSSEKEPKDDSKGFLGLFKKKRSDEKEIEPKVRKTTEKPTLSENVVKDMHESESFLIEEVDKYHDAHAIVQEPVSTESTTTKIQDDDDRKGFFGLFSKKRSEEKEIEPISERTLDKPILSEKVIADMHESELLLKGEIDRYHDVRPIIQKPAVILEKTAAEKEEQKEDRKGLLGLFKKGKSQEKETVSVPKSADKLVLSESVIRNMHDSESFLIEEINRYHDVRPIFKESITISKENKPTGQEIPPVKEQKDDGKGFLGIFKKKKSEKKEEPKIEKTKEKPVLSEAVMRDMNLSKSFLTEEIDRYHDVRPIVKEVVPIKEKSPDQKEQKQDGKGFFGLFKKKHSEEKEIESKIEKVKGKPVLSKNVVKHMQDSDSFLTEEINRYHDVRPLVKEVKLTLEKEPTKDEHKDDSKGFLGLLKKKDITEEKIVSQEQKSEDNIVLSEKTIKEMYESESFLKDEIEKYHDVRPILSVEEKVLPKEELTENKTGFFGLFQKKTSKNKQGEPKLDKPGPSENVKPTTEINKNDTITDVAAVASTESSMQKTEVIPSETIQFEDSLTVDVKESDIKEQKLLPENKQTGIFVEAKNIPETTNFLNTELERYEDSNVSNMESAEFKQIPKLSETTLLDMITTNDFIREEVARYNDVRPAIINKSDTLKKSEDKQSKSGKLFGLFGKKKSQDRESSSEPEKKADKKEKVKRKSRSKEKDIQKDDVKDKSAVSKSVEQSTDNKNFVKSEIDRYQDKEQIGKLPDIQPQETEEEIKEKAGGFFGMFSKKNKPQEKADERVTGKKDQEESLEGSVQGISVTISNELGSADFIENETRQYDAAQYQKPTPPQKESAEFEAPLKEVSTVQIKEDHGLLENKQVYGDKISSVQELSPKTITTITKETIVIKDTQLEPNITTAVSKLEEEIESRLRELREEAKCFDEDIDDKKEMKNITEVVEFQIPTSQDTSMKTLIEEQAKEAITKEETKDTTKKSGILSLIGKKKSQDKEPSVERYVMISEDNISLESPKLKDRKKSGSPFKIFGKKQISDDENQNISEDALENTSTIATLSEDAILNMQNTHTFLSTEVTNYEDGKPEIITDLDEDTEKIKSSGLFGIFSKKDKSTSPKAPKRKFKKYKVSKSTAEPERSPEKIAATHVDHKEEVCDNSTDGDHRKPVEILVRAEGSKQDIKSKKVAFADVEVDIAKAVCDIKEEVEENAEKALDDSSKIIKDTTEKIEGTAHAEVAKEIEGIDKTLNETKYVTEKILKEVIDPEEMKEQVVLDENKGKRLEYILSTCGATSNATDTDKKIKDKTDKSKKSFFSKLGAKIGVKSDDIKTSANDVETFVTEAKHAVTDKVEEINTKADGEMKNSTELETAAQKSIKPIIDENSLKEEGVKDERSSFVIEIMQSFDDTLEHMKEDTDVKIATNNITRDSQNVSDRFQSSQQFIEKEKDSTKKLEGFAIAVQNVDDAVAKATIGEIQEIKELVIEPIDKTSEVIKHTDLTSIDRQISGKVMDVKHEVLPTEKLHSDISDNVKHATEKSPKKGKTFLGKLGKKISGHGDESKDKSHDEIPKLESDKKPKKSQRFFGKLGDKLTGKVEDAKENAEQLKSVKEPITKSGSIIPEFSKISDSKTEISEKKHKEPEYENICIQKFTTNTEAGIKKTTLDFIEAESFNMDDKIPRTVSDYGGKIRDTMDEPPRKISEANIDLSNLPTNIQEYSSNLENMSSYVTSPTLPRRTVSQRLSKDERPEVVEITSSENDATDDEWYIVTEPDDAMGKKGILKHSQYPIDATSRKPLFHIASEDDENLDSLKVKHTTTIDRQESATSNVLETLTELKIDELITDLTKSLSDSQDVTPLEAVIKKEEQRLEEHKKESQTEVDLIEQKLRALDEALDSLEQTESNIEEESGKDDKKIEKKLRRVERKFERMASEILDKDVIDGKPIQLTSTEVEAKRDNEYHRLVSQLSTEEISDFQREYSHLWDEHTFSKSEDWDSKTPDSQEDVQELPQGEEASSSAVREPSPSIRAEGEESEKDETGSERKAADQHALSDEMKALLKELEKESKQ